MNFTLKKSDLNFKVYTVAAKPTTPGAENDIAIISSVPMTNWLMSPEKPSGTPRNDGDVWIQYSTQGNTKNILKQNALMISTISAWQYVDGVWVDREAVSCQGGEWVDWWNGELYTPGNEWVNVTGGWIEKFTASGNYTNRGTLTKNEDSMLIKATPKSSLVVRTANTIDLSKYQTIEFTIKCISSHSSYRMICIVDESENYIAGTHGEANVTCDMNTGETKTFTLDVSSIGKGYYVGFSIWAYEGINIGYEVQKVVLK